MLNQKTDKVKLSFEHNGYEWLPYEQAVERVTFKNSREILEKVNTFVGKNNI